MEQLEREEKQRPAWLEKIKKAAGKDKKLLARIAACLLIVSVIMSTPFLKYTLSRCRQHINTTSHPVCPCCNNHS